MPTYSNMSPMQLRRRRQELQEELKFVAPILWAELELVEKLLAAADTPSSKTYAACRGPWAAINLCLDLNGDFKLGKKAVMDEILAGGYLTEKPKAARGLLNDSILHQIGKGGLLMRHDLIGRPKPRHK